MVPFHKRDVHAEHSFCVPEPGTMAPSFPVIVDSVNDDGTYQGHFDLENMSAIKRILATTW